MCFGTNVTFSSGTDSKSSSLHKPHDRLKSKPHMSCPSELNSSKRTRLDTNKYFQNEWGTLNWHKFQLNEFAQTPNLG
mgnify:CR=1 FL=1